MVRPERPSRLNSTYADASADGRPPQGPPELRGRGTGSVQTSAPRATSGFGKRQRRIIVERLMPYQDERRGSWSSVGKRSATVRLIRRLRTTESTMMHQEEAEQQEAGVVLHDEARARTCRSARRRRSTRKKLPTLRRESTTSRTSLRTGPAVAGGQVGVVAAGGAGARAAAPGGLRLRASACRPPCAWWAEAAAGPARRPWASLRFGVGRPLPAALDQLLRSGRRRRRRRRRRRSHGGRAGGASRARSLRV